MPTPVEILTAEIVYAPDGCFPNGKGRPWRAVKVARIDGPYVIGNYVDTGEQITCPAYGVALTEKGL